MEIDLPIALVVAVASNGVIGDQGSMPWHIPSDLKRFKRDTLGKPIIMGRKTYQSIGRPLPDRLNIVVSRSGFCVDGTTHATDLESALFIAQGWAREHGALEICVIGGGQIYAEIMARASKLYVTHVKGEPDGDTRFPEISSEEWQVVASEAYAKDARDSAATEYRVYERKPAKVDR